MQFFFDHIIAASVTITLALAIIAQQVNVKQGSLERMSIYQAKAHSLSFAEWVEDDVVKLGSRFGSSRDRFDTDTEVETTADGNSVWYTNVFEYFYNEESDGQTADRVEVRYDVASNDSTLLSVNETTGDSTFVPLYTLTRSEKRGAYELADPANGVVGGWIGTEPDWTVSTGYRSPPGLRYFRITPMDSDGNDVTHDPTEADYVRIEFEVIPTMVPLHRARLIPNRPLHWETTLEIRPF